MCNNIYWKYGDLKKNDVKLYSEVSILVLLVAKISAYSLAAYICFFPSPFKAKTANQPIPPTGQPHCLFGSYIPCN